MINCNWNLSSPLQAPYCWNDRSHRMPFQKMEFMGSDDAEQWCWKLVHHHFYFISLALAFPYWNGSSRVCHAVGLLGFVSQTIMIFLRHNASHWNLSSSTSSAYHHVPHKIFYYFILFCILYVSFDGYVMWRHNVSRRTQFRFMRKIYRRGKRTSTQWIKWWQNSQCAHNQSKFNGRIASKRRSSKRLNNWTWTCFHSSHSLYLFRLHWVVLFGLRPSLHLVPRNDGGTLHDIIGKQIC